ncbi:MAG: hypothetical protein AAB553_06010 [Patescibacteria group bacterium]
MSENSEISGEDLAALVKKQNEELAERRAREAKAQRDTDSRSRGGDRARRTREQGGIRDDRR